MKETQSDCESAFPPTRAWCTVPVWGAGGGLLFAAGDARCRGSFDRSRAGDGQQLAGVHALVDAQLAAVLQHPHGYPGDVARIVQAAVRTAAVGQTQLLQHGAQLGLRPGHLWTGRN